MYVPPHFAADDPAWCRALIRAEPFATLVTVDDAGAPFATHLPFLLDEERGAQDTLLGHVARTNPQWRHFRPGHPVLVVFAGPHAYVSPAWYADGGAGPREAAAASRAVTVPTWNYVAVHAYGVPAVIEDPDRVLALLDRLVRSHEEGRPDPWSLRSQRPDQLALLARGIVAFEIPIDRLEGKAKLSQNRSEADRAGVRAGLRASGDPLAAALAAAMEERGAG